MRFVDWFAGIGGFRVGLERAGAHCVGACEVAPFPRAVYAERFGHAPELEDVRAVTPAQVPDADLWTAGFPCQDVSPAGPKRGLRRGTRSGLVWELLRLAAVRLPTWLLLENSPGILVRGRGFGRLLAELDRLGYVGAWRVLDAQHFGVSQHRERVYVLARRAGACGPDPGAVLEVTPGVRGDPRARGAAGPDAPAGARGRAARGRGAVSRSVTTRAGDRRHGPDAEGEHRSAEEQAEPGDERRRPMAVSATLTASRGRRSAEGPLVVGCDLALAATGAPAVAYCVPQMGSNMSAVRETDTARTLDRNGAWGAAAGGTLVLSCGPEPHARGDGLAPAVRTQHGDDRPAVLGPDGVGVRSLTPRECERLQGLPDDWTLVPYRGKPARDAPRYKAIGNAVVPAVVEWIGRRLLTAP